MVHHRNPRRSWIMPTVPTTSSTCSPGRFLGSNRGACRISLRRSSELSAGFVLSVRVSMTPITRGLSLASQRCAVGNVPWMQLLQEVRRANSRWLQSFLGPPGRSPIRESRRHYAALEICVALVAVTRLLSSCGMPDGHKKCPTGFLGTYPSGHSDPSRIGVLGNG